MAATIMRGAIERQQNLVVEAAGMDTSIGGRYAPQEDRGRRLRQGRVAAGETSAAGFATAKPKKMQGPLVVSGSMSTQVRWRRGCLDMRARVGADVPLCGVTFVAGTRRGSRTGFTRKVAQTQSLQGHVQRKIVPVLACVRRGVAMVLACRVCSLLGAPQFTVDEELGLVDGDLATVHSVCHPV